MKTGKLTEALIRFALETRAEDIPGEVYETQKKSLLDSIGVMCAATTLERACEPFLTFAVENSGKKLCTIVGTGQKASPVLSAMANGALIHALDYEDGHDASKTHPNTASIPTMLALAEFLKAEGKSVGGKEFLAALIISGEIACRMKLALRINDLEQGWYSPPMFSAFGAVFGGARFLGFSEEELMDALSICMTQVLLPGQSARSGESVLRAVRDAFSAKAAVFSLMMARQGVRARMDEPLEGKLGLYHMMAGGDYDPECISGGLGETWEFQKLRYKPWPCCGTVHGTLDALLTLLRENSVSQEEIQRIHLEVNPVHLRVLEPREVKYSPESLAAAKFSLPFSLALAVRYGDVRLDTYKEELLYDKELLSIAEKVTYQVREKDDSAYFSDDHVKVFLDTVRGEFVYEEFISPGAPGRPLTAQQMQDKFVDCMKFAAQKFTEEQVLALYQEILNFELLEDAGNFSLFHI